MRPHRPAPPRPPREESTPGSRHATSASPLGQLAPGVRPMRLGRLGRLGVPAWPGATSLLPLHARPPRPVVVATCACNKGGSAFCAHKKRVSRSLCDTAEICVSCRTECRPAVCCSHTSELAVVRPLGADVLMPPHSVARVASARLLCAAARLVACSRDSVPLAAPGQPWPGSRGHANVSFPHVALPCPQPAIRRTATTRPSSTTPSASTPTRARRSSAASPVRCGRPARAGRTRGTTAAATSRATSRATRTVTR